MRCPRDAAMYARILGLLFKCFGIIFQCILEFFAKRFVDCESRLTRSELTATFEKMPRTAKNWQKPNANERRPPIYILQHAIHETRYTEANASNNTGSAVLAPHGALGYVFIVPLSVRTNMTYHAVGPNVKKAPGKWQKDAVQRRKKKHGRGKPEVLFVPN